MKQSNLCTLIEVKLNTVSGMAIAWIVAQLLSIAAPWIQEFIWAGFDFHISPTTNLITTPIFTVVSILRGWAWRRAFENKLTPWVEGKLEKWR